jgi:hypothetical protein
VASLLLAWRTLRPWRWRRYVPPKRWWTATEPHDAITQIIVLFIVAVVRTLNPTLRFLFSWVLCVKCNSVTKLNSEDYCLLRCDTMGPDRLLQTFRRKVLHLSSGYKSTLVSYSSTLKMEAARSSETPVTIYQTTQRHIPQYSNHNSDRH